MVNANKILTVSYGTFSCTLEGFDEPFSTMKSIAEYFRDLAADDRYFGAEPPTPDAEMLHRIAEREIQRRVESHVSDTGIVLRPAAQTPAHADLTPPVQPGSGPQSGPEPGVGQHPGKSAEPDSFSDRLQRIRAVTAQPAARTGYAEDEQAEKIVVDTPIETAFADIGSAAPAEGRPETEPPEPTTSADDSAGPDTKAEDDLATRAADEAAAYAPDDEDTFAGAAVAQPGSPRTKTSDAPAAAEPAADDDAAISAVLGSLDLPPVMEESVLGPDPALDADLDPDLDPDETDVAADVEDTATDTASGPNDTDAAADETAVQEPPVTETPDAAVEIDTDTGDGPAEPVTPAAASPEAPEATQPDAPAPVRPRRPVARVVKVRRATAEEAKKPIDVPGISTLSDEDEAALARELAEVRADAERDAKRALAADPLAIEGGDEPTDRIAARKEPARTAFDDVDMSETEVAIDRILEKTNTQLKSGEATRRRSAIQHLKAAVQATRADREAAGETVHDDDPRDAYRDDLARVVHPRRPGGDGDGTKRRMAPLVLVSEQRIDEVVVSPGAEGQDEQPGKGRGRNARRADASDQPVRPRRVTKGNLALSPDQSPDLSVVGDTPDTQPDTAPDTTPDHAPMFDGFRRYLADSDAEGDTELLEAAMAFITQEVGRANVTRPQLLTLVMNAKPDLSREDALSAFGALQRDGRIVKVKRGLFVLGEASRFFDIDD